MASLLAKSDPHSAIDHTKKAIALGYDAPDVWRALGHHYAEIGAWKESLEAFNRYLEAPPAGNEAEREATRAFVKETVLPRVLAP
jgi:lipoprotein NlpI